MKQRIEKYIPQAIELISEVDIAKNGEVNNEFNGYFSSFGAAIVQSGLKPALAFFSNEKRKKERSKILVAIYKLVVDKNNNEKIEDIKPRKILDYVIKHKNKEEQLKTKIIDASIALKLAVRTYKLVKK